MSFVVTNAPASAYQQVFTYVVTGAEADPSDFMIALPVAEGLDTYNVQGTLATATVYVGLSYPDSAAGDRTTTQFRVVATASMTAGDEIDFLISS